MKIKSLFSPFEIFLWLASVMTVVLSFVLMPQKNPLSLVTSLVGVTALIFLARGNAIGQVLIIIFAGLYGAVSYGQAYYGEMITYLGMSAPIALVALVSWLKNPYEKGQVRVATLRPRTVVILFSLAITVGVVFYFVLCALGNANLPVSTISVTTSFMAAGFTVLRSPYFALAYATNDIVLIILWCFAIPTNPAAVAMIVCFLAFLVNDFYSFVSWLRMKKRQTAKNN